jgi:hypothetical protein
MLREIMLGTLKSIITPYQKVRVKYDSHGELRLLWEGEICNLPQEYELMRLDFISTLPNNDDIISVYLSDGEV